MRVRVGEEGTWYEFASDKLLVREARELQDLTGMGLQDFSDGIRHGKVDSLVFMLYLAKRRAGEAVRFREFDDMNLADLEIDAEEDEAQQPDEPESDASPLAGGANTNGAALPPPTELRPATVEEKQPRKAGRKRAATG